MDAEADRWRRVKDLFAEAVERPAADRARWLAAACSGDDALRRQVESLLASGGEASEFFRKPIPPPARLGPGTRIAGYDHHPRRPRVPVIAKRRRQSKRHRHVSESSTFWRH